MTSFIRLRQRSTVVLPQPDGPMNAVISFFAEHEVHVANGTERAVVDLEVAQFEHGRLRSVHRRGSHPTSDAMVTSWVVVRTSLILASSGNGS